MRALRIISLLPALCAGIVLAGSAAAAPVSRGVTGTDPALWVTQVCTSVTSWNQAIVKRSATLRRVPAADLVGMHRALTAFLQGLVDDTDTMIASVDGAGVPAAPRGQEIARALHQGFTTLRGYFVADVAKSKQLSKRDRARFAAGAAALSKAIDAQSTELGSTFAVLGGKLTSPALDAAMQRAAACRSYR
jgi:hypothetical protein